jgi:membrane-associated phospholipid phosphatase
VTEFLEALETGWGLEVVLWFQSWRTPLLFDAAFALSLTGEVLGFVLVWAMIYWCIDARLGRRVGVTYFLAAWLNQWLKEWWQRPRPFQVSPEVDWPYPTDSFGLPSGHATLTVTGWGLVWMWIKRRWVRIFVGIYITLTVLTRLILGVHYPQDVLLGTLIGIGCLVLYARLEPPLTSWIASRGTGEVLALIAGVAVVMALIHPVVVAGLPEHRADGAGVIGIFLGVAAGLLLEVRTVGFAAGGRWWKRIVRYGLGVIGLLALMAASATVLEGLEPRPFFNLIGSVVIALWVSFGAPWVFVRTGLADTEAR